MTTKLELENALKDALRSGDDLRKRTLRMVIASIKNQEIERRGPLDDAAILATLQKEVKSRQESIADAQRAGRPDLEAASLEEIRVLESFLPQALSPEELEALVQAAIREVGASSPREMGQVMKVLMPRLQGRATGDQAGQMVRKLLQA